MPELNKERIFNESPKKVLIREFNNLKNDYTKVNAIKYKSLYENASLSFILENSEFIFKEPMKGIDFYTEVISEATIPLDKIENEYQKISNYCEEYMNDMSDIQKNKYEKLLNIVESKFESMKNVSNIYVNITDNCESMHKYYDALYEYNKTNDDKYINDIEDMINESESLNIIDTVNILSSIPDLYPQFLEYVYDTYVESPQNEDDYMLNAYTTNIMCRLCREPYFKEKVNSISNMNLRHLLKGLGGVESSDIISNINEETVHIDDVIFYSTADNAINSLFENTVFEECLQSVNDEEKCLRLVCEKAVIDMNLVFISMESEYNDGNLAPRDSIVEKICIESNDIEKIPQTYDGQIQLLLNESNKLQDEIDILCERYFRSDGGPGKVISDSMGYYGKDNIPTNTDQNSDLYEPAKKSSMNDNEEKKEENGENKDNNYKDPEEIKSRLTEKYSKMNIDDDFKSLTEAKNNIDTKDKKKEYPEVEKPEKPNIFRRISNKALDANSKFKRKLANGRRTATDAKNAGNAVTKIPRSISDSLKRSIDDFEEMDDNKRKEYLLKPGTRKKYFRALKIAIIHGCAFAIDPILNIILLICKAGSKKKDIRIRNELMRELRVEIKIVEEKISDANLKGDRTQKYKLMRIKEKLQAELDRVSYNSKVI